MPSVLFIEQFYYPDGWGGAEIPLDVTKHLAAAGFTVEVICGGDPYAPLNGAPPADPRKWGVKISRAWPLARHLGKNKLLRQAWFYFALVPLLLFRRPPDIFVTQTNPPLAAILVAAVARLTRKPMMIIAMDIYPEILFAHGLLRQSRLVAAVLNGIFGWAYKSASSVVSLGPTMSRRLANKGVECARIVEIPNWATGTLGVTPPSENSLLREWGLANKFVVLYSGNLGWAHEFETLLKGVERAHRSLPSLRVVFIGGGSRLPEVRRLVEELEIGSIVRFSNLLPTGQLPQSFGIANLAVVTLQPGFEGLVVPSKTQGYMARGIPILYVGPDSDVKHFIERSAGGIAIDLGDIEGLASTLIDCFSDQVRLATLGVSGRSFYDVTFSKDRGLNHYETVVRSLVTLTIRPS